MIFYDWPKYPTFDWLCKSDEYCGKLIGIFGADPDGPDTPIMKCGASIEYGIRAGGKNNIDDVRNDPNILFDIVNFNNV